MKKVLVLILACSCVVYFIGKKQLMAEIYRPKADFKILFNNDTTNTLSSIRKNDLTFDEALQSTIDETAGIGIDVHLISPNMGWTPWWPSKVYSPIEHAKWLKEKYNKEGDFYERYAANGGDVIKVFVDRCHEKGLKAFVSYRLNDGHHILNNKESLRHQYVETERATAVCRFYSENPQYILGPDLFVNDLSFVAERLQNWIHPEVRKYKFDLIKEICENYDIDGLELDFMRHPYYFRIDQTTRQQRVDIMTDYIRNIRQVLDQTQRDGKYRWLSIRVPFRIKDADRIGIDFPSIVNAGVDMVNLSCHFVTEQQNDLVKIKTMIPDTPIYLEMTHTTNYFLFPNSSKTIWRLTSDQEFYTTAHLAYIRGAVKGISVFNFAYYRNPSSLKYLSQPPFHIFEKLRHKEWVARQPQLYFLSRYDSSYVRVTKRSFKIGRWKNFTMDMVPPTGGWTTDGRLRIQFLRPIGNSKWEVKFNGIELRPNDDISELYDYPYKDGIGNSESLLAWTLPYKLVIDGINKVGVRAIAGKPPEIIYIDIAIK